MISVEIRYELLYQINTLIAESNVTIWEDFFYSFF